MSKNKVRIIQMETVLIAILLICTLANLLTNKMFTAVLLVVSAIVFINLIKKKRILRVNKKKIVIVLLLFGLFYLALFYTLGIYTGFYHQTKSFGLKTIINYIIPITAIIISTEIIRDRCLVNPSIQSKIATVVIGTIVDVSLYLDVYKISTMNGFLALLGFVTFASIANNILFTYISDKYGEEPVIVYKLITYLYLYFIPIAPDVYIFFRTFVRMVYPLIIYTYLDKYYDMDREVRNIKVMHSQIFSLLSCSIVMILVIALISCKFYYGVLVIGSESMAHTLDKGDVIFYVSEKNKINKDDIIVFKKDDVKIVHRVILIKMINHETRYYTKGDANKSKDEGYVLKNELQGKVLFKIKYIGAPTLWLREIFDKEG